MIPEITIITPAYTIDRLHDIKQLLDSVAVQTNNNLEMIIVTESSPDLSKAITEYIKAKNYSWAREIYNESPRGASSARNLAIKQSQGNIIAFVDDDAMLNSDWIDEIIKTFKEDDSVIGVTGPIVPLWQAKAKTWFPPEFYWIFSCTADPYTDKTEVRNGYCTNLAFKKDAFKYAGLFNPELGVKGRGKRGWQEPGSEETELALRITHKTGKRIIYNPKVKVQHKVYAYRMAVGFIIRRTFWEGYAKASLRDKLRSLNSETNILSTEHALLKRIVFYRIPHILLLLFRQPKSALLQLGVVITGLTCVAAGYGRYNLDTLFHSGK